MLVVKLKELKGTDQEVHAKDSGWVSHRLLRKKDGLGFSFHDTTVFAGTKLNVWYKNHFESCYCIESEGEVETASGGIYPIRAGTLYALDKHDKHILRAKTDLRLICIFYPAITGHEIPDKDGSYPLSG